MPVIKMRKKDKVEAILQGAIKHLEIITGRTGRLKTWAPGPFAWPALRNGLGPVVFFGIPCPSARSGPRLTHTPDGFLLKMCGNKWGCPGNECWWDMSGGVTGITRKYPPEPHVRAWPGEGKPISPLPVTNTLSTTTGAKEPSIPSAAEKSLFPYSTLRRWLKRRQLQVAGHLRIPVLTEYEQGSIVR